MQALLDLSSDPMNAKPDTLKKLLADIQKEIARKQPLGDADLERNTRRAQALLRLFNEERERRAAERARPIQEFGSALRSGQQPVIGRLPKRDAIVLALGKLSVASPPARVVALVTELFGETRDLGIAVCQLPQGGRAFLPT